jgi:protein-S-isoprenylcysteine O-methyltransferase Ste14
MLPPILPVQRIAIGVTLLGWAALGVALAFPLLGRRGRARDRDISSLAGMALQGVGFALVFSVNDVWVDVRPIHVVLASLSVLLTTTAIFLVLTALRALGKQWSLSARVLEQHQLITTGPYALVRHPIYTGFLVLLLATGASKSTLIASAGAFTFYVIGTLLRTTREERLLRSAFGAEYDEYAKRVPALVPRPWPGDSQSRRSYRG